jgi:hypothetical protein
VTVTVTDCAGQTGAASSPVAVNANVVGNPGFESPTSGWNTSGSTTGVTLARVDGATPGRDRRSWTLTEYNSARDQRRVRHPARAAHDGVAEGKRQLHGPPRPGPRWTSTPTCWRSRPTRHASTPTTRPSSRREPGGSPLDLLADVPHFSRTATYLPGSGPNLPGYASRTESEQGEGLHEHHHHPHHRRCRAADPRLRRPRALLGWGTERRRWFALAARSSMGVSCALVGAARGATQRLRFADGKASVPRGEPSGAVSAA